MLFLTAGLGQVTYAPGSAFSLSPSFTYAFTSYAMPALHPAPWVTLGKKGEPSDGLSCPNATCILIGETGLSQNTTQQVVKVFLW